MKKLSSVTISGGLTVDQATTLSGIVSVGGIGTGAYTSVLVRNSSNQMLYRTYSDFVNDISGSLNLSGYVPTSRTLTINGTTYDLSADRTWTISNVETDTLDSVTDRGNITTNTIDVGGVKSDYFLLDTTATPALSAGMMRWNDTDGTAEIALKYGDVVLQLGQEQHYVVRNSTGSTIQNGTAVYASGVTAGSGRIEAAPYIADGSIREVRFLGLATHDITNGVNGVVTHFGYVRDLDTRGTAVTAISVGDENWSVGDILYVHPTVHGKLTNVKPKHEITVAIVINRHQSSGVLFVRPSSAGHLDDIHDVILTSETNGQLLKYDSTAGAWVNWSPNYLTAEADTLATVTARGASTTGAIAVNGITTIQNDGYLKFIAGSVGTTGFSVFNAAQNGYLSNRITTSDHARGWGWELTDSLATSASPNVFFRIGYDGTVSYLTSGNFGIGTTAPVSHSPSRRTIVVADTTNGANIEIWGNNGGGKSILQSVGGDTYVGNLANGSGAGTTYITSGNGSTYTTFLANGNVGIGASNPQSKLHIETSSSNPFRMVRGSTNFGFEIGGGAIGLYDYEDSIYRWYVDSIGNIGIGTTSPSQKLQVNGSAEINSSLYVGADIVLTRADTTPALLFTTQNGLRWTYTGGGNYWTASLSIDSANLINMNGSPLATRGWVNSQGFLTSVSDIWVNTTGDTMTGALTIQGGWASTILDGDNVVLRKPNYSSGGWARTLLNFQEYDGTSLFQIGGYGSNNTMSYGYLGSAYNTPTFRWYADKRVMFDGNVGIGTSSPAEKLHVLGRGIFDGGSGDSSTDAVLYVTKATNDDWGLYVNNSGLDYGIYARMSPSANYAIAIHNGTTWTTRITGNAVIYLGEKNAIEGNYDSWLRLNNSSQYASGVYTPGVMRADGGFNVSGSTVWHAGNDGSGSGLDADLLDGQNSTEFLRLLSGGAEASLDSYTDNGLRPVSFAGHSQHLLSWNAGGSTGTVQQLFHYGVPNNGWRIRNKTDNSSWSDWGYVVMASSNQGLISGTIATQSWVGSQSYATTSYVTTQINNLIAGAPGALDTLDELAAALGDDASFATTVTNSIAAKLPLAGGTMSGNITMGGGTNILFTGGSHAIAGNNTGYLHFYDYTNIYFNNELVIRGGITNDGGNVQINDNLNISGELAFLDGSSSYSNIIRAAAYPTEGFPTGSNYWMEYRAKGGHHFIVNTDGGVGSGANTMDDFVVWQGAIDGNRLLEVSNTGNLWIAGALTESSSLKLKENVETSEGNLEKVVNLRPVTYNKIGSQTKELGLIAEEVAEVYPEFVQYDESGEPIGVNYSRLTAALIGAVKELTQRIETLENNG